MLKLFPFLLIPSLIFGEEVAFPTPPDIETGAFFYSFMKMLVVLGIMVGVLLAISWYMKRLVGSRVVKGNEDSLIKLIDQRSLSGRTVIYLLEIEGKSLVVGESANGLVRLMDEK